MNNHQILQIQDQATRFLDALFTILNEQRIEIQKHWNIDHLCFRTQSEEEYQFFKKGFLGFSELLIESDVNGRMISTFKLNHPIIFRDWSIDLIELPAPKKGKITNTGFEHIEVVIDVPFEDIITKYSNAKFDTGGLQKNFNQELEIDFGMAAIKFHHLSLESVINVERNSSLHLAIQRLNVLHDFKNYGPLVSGTFPLGIQTEQSDVDIILNSDELADLLSKIEKKYSHHPGYRAVLDSHLKTLVVEFKFNDFKFEIYAEDRNSVKQNANLHFLLQERILKLTPRTFRQRIVELKALGVKTEAAFAQVMGLDGDPYLALIEIRHKSEGELKEILKLARY